MQEEEIIVVGAGASGMMAAVAAAGDGGRVLVLEKMKRAGKKLLATGNGKCNFTNSRQERDCYRGEDTPFIWSALRRFPHERVLRAFYDMGILPSERGGYYYPASGQAASVVEALLRQMEHRKVRLHTREAVKSLCPSTDGGNGFVVTTARETYHAARVILAAGGMASPVHGTTGDGYLFARDMGLDVLEPLPALTSCTLRGNFREEWAGVRTQGQITLFDGSGGYLAQDQGELQFVASGISGIPVFQVSRYAARALSHNDHPYLLMDCMTSYTQEELEREIMGRRKRFPEWSALDSLDGMMHRKLAKALLKCLLMDPGDRIGGWTMRQICRVAAKIKSWRLEITAVGGFDRAQVTCGGVLTDQIDPATMQVKRRPGLYITGEMLDVDGICGGYNLQWAWTSGYLAGKDAAKAQGEDRHDKNVTDQSASKNSLRQSACRGSEAGQDR